MTETIETLRERMEAAAEAQDFEEARRLRDTIALVQGGASPEEAWRASAAGSLRQSPGAMGLGTGQQKVALPPDWRPPAKPDLLTSRKGSPRK